MTITPIGMFKGAISVGDIVQVAAVNDLTTLTTYTFSGVSMGDAKVGDYILIAAAGFTSGTATRNIISITLDGVEAAYLSSAYAAQTQTSRNGLVAATGNSTATIVVTFVAASHWGSIVVYRCRDIDPYPVDVYTKSATPLTGDLLIPARGLAMSNSSNAVNNAVATWTGLTKDSNINNTGQRTQSTAIGEFLTEQNKNTSLCTWNSTTAPVICGVSFAPKGYYAPASLTYLGKQQIVGVGPSFTFNAFNAGSNSLGAANPGRVIYITVSGDTGIARNMQSVTVAGKSAAIVTPIANVTNWAHVAWIVLNNETSGDIVVNMSFNVANCAIGVWVGYGYDTEHFIADQFASTNALVTASLRCMSIGVGHHSTVQPVWNSGFISRDQTTKDCFGDMQWLGSSTGVGANPFYIGSNAATLAYAMFYKYEATTFTGQVDFLGAEWNATDLTTYTFSAFNNGGNSLGPAAADRIIYVALMGINGSTARQIVSVTIAGVTAIQVTPVTTGGSCSTIFAVQLPTGTNGDVVATYSGALNRMSCGVWYTRGFDAATYQGIYNIANAAATIATLDKGVVLCGVYENSTAVPYVTSGAAHLVGAPMEGASTFAHNRNTKAGSVSLNASRPNAPALCAVSLYPTGQAPVAPTIASAISYQSSSSVTSHAVTLPSSMAVGDMCIIISGAGSVTINTPAGWTSIGNTATSPANNAFYRIIDGTEGATVTVTTSAAGVPNFIAHRITGASKTIPPEFSQGGVVSSASPGAPAITPSWGFAPILCIACVTRVAVAAPTAFPTNYTINPTNININTHTLASVGRQMISDTEATASYTFAAAASSRGFMIAIRG